MPQYAKLVLRCSDDTRAYERAGFNTYARLCSSLDMTDTLMLRRGGIYDLNYGFAYSWAMKLILEEYGQWYMTSRMLSRLPLLLANFADKSG